MATDTAAPQLRAVSQAELPSFLEHVFRAFGEEPADEDLAVELLTTEAERSLAAYDDDQIVGTAGAFTFDLAVPGGRAAAGGVTFVGVAPTHRRRGVLSAMMRHQIDDIRERSEPLAVLWASEAAIYGRFGYGVAVRACGFEVDRLTSRLRADLPTADSVRLSRVPTEDMAKVVGDVLSSLAERPGTFARGQSWLQSLTTDTAWRRHGFAPMECVAVLEGERPIGFALYRAKPGSVPGFGLPDGEVMVIEQQALTPTATVALTRYLLGLDLMRRIRWWNQPLDAALPLLLSDPRQARTTVTDSLHIRIVDLPAALTARRYAAPVDVVLEVSDPQIGDNEGRWRLQGDRHHARCDRTDDAPAVVLNIEALGAAYLGGTPLRALADAGRLRTNDEAALTELSMAFRWDVEPCCPMVF